MVNVNSPTKSLNIGANKAVTLDTSNSGGTVKFGNGGLLLSPTRTPNVENHVKGQNTRDALRHFPALDGWRARGSGVAWIGAT